MSDPISVRLAQKGDFSQIVSLLQEVGLLTDGLSPGMPNLYVAEMGGIIVGCAALEFDGSTGLLRSVGVLPTVQSTGIGGRMVEAVHARVADLGLECVFLLTTTAEEYFPKFGYRLHTRETLPPIVTSSAEYTACLASGAAVLRKVIKQNQAHDQEN